MPTFLDARLGLSSDNMFRFMAVEPITMSALASAGSEFLTAAEIKAKRRADKSGTQHR